MHHEPDTIVTALVGYIDPSLSRMTYASAGHPPPMIAVRNDEPAQVLPYGDPPLGVGYEGDLRNRHVAIEPCAVIALYTDGIIEFSNDVVAAEDKLRTAVALLVGNTRIARPAVAIQEIVVDDLPTRDDAALLVLQFSPVAFDEPRGDAADLERSWRFHSSDAYTAHASRQEIMSFLRPLAADPDAVFIAELILGEILANTVEHAPGLVEVSIDWTGERPILTVRDTGPGLRTLEGKLPSDVMAEGGRGIFLVGYLADEASVRQSPGYGAEVRAVLPIRRKNVVTLRADG
jgi:anti-sigma regulatory factor (Ser/Thr protein kinase)